MSRNKMVDCHALEQHEWTGYFPESLGARLRSLHRLAMSLGCEVKVGSYTDPSVASSRLGDCVEPWHCIRINARNHGYQAVDTMAHEIGHAIFRHRGDELAQELQADNVATALLIDEEAFHRHFDPARHLSAGANRDIRETVDLFGCGWRTLRKRYDRGPRSTLASELGLFA